MGASQRDGDAPSSSRSEDAQPLQGTTRDNWSFMEPWIDVLEGRLMTHANEAIDPVRVGGDLGNNDFWIEVQLMREEQLQIHLDGEQAAMSLLREAIVLTHILGVCNYELWYKWLVVESRIYTPPQSFIPESDTIQLRYAFTFVEQHDEGFMNWDQSLAFLLGAAGWSDEFRRDLKVAQKLLARHGINWKELEPLPIKLRLFSEDFGDVEISLNCLTRAVMEMEKIVSAAWQNPDEGLGLSVRFQTTELDVDIKGETMTALSFQALHQLLRLGVPVGSLCLPQLPFFVVDEERLASLKDIVGFFRTILGITADRGRPPTRVCRLVMPFYYGRTRWFAPFCSALASSRFLRVLHLVPNDTVILVTAGFGPEGAARHRAWSWLAFALFSFASSTSVESLILTGLNLFEADVDAIKAINESPDPITTLDQLPNEQARSGILANRFLAHRRATLELAQTQADTRKRTSQQFCAKESDRLMKKQRVDKGTNHSHSDNTSMSAFRALAIVSTRQYPGLQPNIDQYVRLLQLLGPRLRGLAVGCHKVDDYYLPKVLALCPHLESLDIRGATLNLAGAIHDAYRQLNLPLTSLQLSGARIPTSLLIRITGHLLQGNVMEATLTRLQFDVWRDSSLICAIINSILLSNKALTHLHLNVPIEDQPHFTREIQQKFHGQLIKRTTVEERKRLVAFFGVLRFLAQKNPRLQIDSDLKDLVLQFATPLPRRRCVTIATLQR